MPPLSGQQGRRMISFLCSGRHCSSRCDRGSGSFGASPARNGYLEMAAGRCAACDRKLMVCIEATVERAIGSRRAMFAMPAVWPVLTKQEAQLPREQQLKTAASAVTASPRRADRDQVLPVGLRGNLGSSIPCDKDQPLPRPLQVVVGSWPSFGALGPGKISRSSEFTS